jgi:endonuclease/exonuclease/phosphatase family metal-dependent hydrolase
MIRFKAMTLNIHKGFSLFNQRMVLPELKAEIRRHGVDIVCLQEVLGEHSVHARKPQFEFIADQIWSHHAYGKNAVYSQGHHGNAILSHFPFQSHENLDISNHRLERRGLLHGTVSAPEWKGRQLHVMTLHLDLLSRGRWRQLQHVVDRIRSRVGLGEPLLVAGDFNDWPEEAGEVLRKVGLREVFFEIQGEHARTYPAPYPLLRLDRIYVRDIEIDSAECLTGVPWNHLSDHLALVAELRF